MTSACRSEAESAGREFFTGGFLTRICRLERESGAEMPPTSRKTPFQFLGGRSTNICRIKMCLKPVGIPCIQPVKPHPIPTSNRVNPALPSVKTLTTSTEPKQVMESADWLSFLPFSTASPNDAAKLPQPCNPRDPPPVFLRIPGGDPFRRWRKARSATKAQEWCDTSALGSVLA